MKNEEEYESIVRVQKKLNKVFKAREVHCFTNDTGIDEEVGLNRSGQTVSFRNLYQTQLIFPQVKIGPELRDAIFKLEAVLIKEVCVYAKRNNPEAIRIVTQFFPTIVCGPETIAFVFEKVPETIISNYIAGDLIKNLSTSMFKELKKV